MPCIALEVKIEDGIALLGTKAHEKVQSVGLWNSPLLFLYVTLSYIIIIFLPIRERERM